MSDIDEMIDRLTERQGHEFALACSRRVQHLMRDQRSIEALDTRERWLRGEATEEEMADASKASADASKAAQAAAWAAASVARDAERTSAAAYAATAGSARGYATGEVATAAASAAARASERAWQREELERMLGEGGGA